MDIFAKCLLAGLVILTWTVFCFRNEIRMFFQKQPRTNSMGPGGGTVSRALECNNSVEWNLAYSKALAELIERIDEKLLKKLLLNKIKAGVTSDQYQFFWKISTAYLEVLKCQSEFKQEEKVSKLQWISRG